MTVIQVYFEDWTEGRLMRGVMMDDGLLAPGNFANNFDDNVGDVGDGADVDNDLDSDESGTSKAGGGFESSYDDTNGSNAGDGPNLADISAILQPDPEETYDDSDKEDGDAVVRERVKMPLMLRRLL
jgi:hypothetical protein